MSSINVDYDYFEHPKTKRLVGLLGKGSEVLPIRLWTVAGKFHYEDGRFTDYSGQEIESLVSWWGSPGAMIDAMLKVGFLEQDHEGFAVHGWMEHNGHILANKKLGKALTAARLAKIKQEAENITARSTTRERTVQRTDNGTVPPLQCNTMQVKTEVQPSARNEQKKQPERPEKPVIVPAVIRNPRKLPGSAADYFLGCAEAIRKRGWHQTGVTRLMDWVLDEKREADDQLLLRLVAFAWEASDKARVNQIREDVVRYTIGCGKKYLSDAADYSPPKYLDDPELKQAIAAALPSKENFQSLAVSFGYYVVA